MGAYPGADDQAIRAVLARSDTFSSLEGGVLDDAAPRFTVRNMAAGEWLIREGEVGDAVYVIASGRLRAVTGSAEHEVVLREMGPGRIVGELALLSRRPRTASVYAVRDSRVLRLSAADFEDVIESHPSLALHISRQVVERTLENDYGTSSHLHALALLPIGDPPPPAVVVDDLARDLVAALDRLGSDRSTVVTSSSIDATFGAGAAAMEANDPRHGELLGWFDAQERAHAVVIHRCVGNPESQAWDRRCLRQADLVLLVADARSQPPSPSSPSASGTSGGGGGGGALDGVTARCELLLLQPADRDLPRGTATWRSALPLVADHHHVHLSSGVARSGGAGREVRARATPGDLDRVARFVAGKAVGLALGGGGPRGFAHLGVLRALEEAGIPIDLVGGTSIGSILGATWCLGWAAPTRAAKCRHALVDTPRLIGPTLPILSFSSGRTLTRLLRDERFFGDVHIEDMWTRFFCVSANLSRARAVIHDGGELWHGVRASISLPGILPPVCHDGDLLVDGGVMNNVPVDEVAARLRAAGGRGRIISVDLEPQVDLEVLDPFPPDLSGWRVLASRLMPGAPRLRAPRLFEVVMRSAAVGGKRAQQDTRAAVEIDLDLHPPTSGVGALDFKGGQALAEVGYRHTMEAIERTGFVP